MRNLQDRASSDSGGSGKVKNRYFDPVDSFGPTPEDVVRKNKKIINIVNSKSCLLDHINKYNIGLRRVSETGDWTHHASCPFPGHREKNPSFGYNSKDDRFYCFGCEKSGRTVEFIAYIDSEPAIEVANRLFIELKISEDDVLLDDAALDSDSNADINNLLFEFSNFVYELYKKYNGNNKAVKFINDVVYVLDVYLYHAVPRGKVSAIELGARIDKCKEVLESFKKKI